MLRLFLLALMIVGILVLIVLLGFLFHGRCKKCHSGNVYIHTSDAYDDALSKEHYRHSLIRICRPCGYDELIGTYTRRKPV